MGMLLPWVCRKNTSGLKVQMGKPDILCFLSLWIGGLLLRRNRCICEIHRGQCWVTDYHQGLFLVFRVLVLRWDLLIPAQIPQRQLEKKIAQETSRGGALDRVCQKKPKKQPPLLDSASLSLTFPDFLWPGIDPLTSPDNEAAHLASLVKEVLFHTLGLTLCHRNYVFSHSFLFSLPQIMQNF